MVGEAPPGGRQPDAAALGLDQRRARLARRARRAAARPSRSCSRARRRPRASSRGGRARGAGGGGEDPCDDCSRIIERYVNEVDVDRTVRGLFTGRMTRPLARRRAARAHAGAGMALAAMRLRPGRDRRVGRAVRRRRPRGRGGPAARVGGRPAARARPAAPERLLPARTARVGVALGVVTAGHDPAASWRPSPGCRSGRRARSSSSARSASRSRAAAARLKVWPATRRRRRAPAHRALARRASDAGGIAFALAAAACWAAYILLTQAVGDEVAGIQGLAVSMPVAGVVAILVAGPSRSGARARHGARRARARRPAAGDPVRARDARAAAADDRRVRDPDEPRARGRAHGRPGRAAPDAGPRARRGHPVRRRRRRRRPAPRRTALAGRRLGDSADAALARA